jgi:ADP-heptose:LPS heptosyltransferase
MDIVILEPAKLGDFIQSAPLVSELIKAHPNAEIRLAALDPSVIDAAKLYFPNLKTLRLEKDLSQGAKTMGTGADLLVNLSLAPSILELAQSLKAKKVIGPQLVNGELHLPLAQQIAMSVMALNRRMGRLNLVDIWRSFFPGSAPKLIRPQSFEANPLPPAELPYIAFHLGAGNHLRRWPVESHVRLAELIGKYYPFIPVIIGTRPERALALKFISIYKEVGLKVEPINLAGKTSLKQLASLMADIELIVSSDTGVMHLAASLGARQLSIFCGPALAHETGPYNENAHILQGLAPCGPCVENLGCQRNQCRGLPKPEGAAMMALSALGQNTIDPKDMYVNPNETHPYSESYRVQIDSFGFKLVPESPYKATLDETSISALAVREGARAVIMEKYYEHISKNKLEIVTNEIKRYKKGQIKESSKNRIIRASLKRIANKAFVDSRLKEIFKKSAEMVLDEIFSGRLCKN